MFQGAENPTIRLAFGGCLQTLAFFRATHFLSLRAEIRGPRGILCTRGEKAHTSKRVSIVAPDKVISKVQCATHRPEGTPHYKTHARYFRTCVEKKGAHKHKREHCRPRQCDFKSAVCAVSSPVNVTFCPLTFSAQINLRGLSSYASFLTNRLSQAAVGCLMLAYSFSPRVHSIPRGPLYNALTASEERSKRLHLRKSNAADIANDRTRSVKCKALAQKRGC